MLPRIFIIIAMLLSAVACVGPTIAESKRTAPEVQVEEEAVDVDVNDPQLLVCRYGNRLYVMGETSMRDSFKRHKHLPYTKTHLGAGPTGETVIFQVKKGDDKFTENLITRFQQIAWKLESNAVYTAWKYQQRIYVIGDEAMNVTFAAHKHLPYTKTLLGAGPAGETVIFQVDKNDPTFADNLRAAYLN